ncbi:Lrp/AsnC family transcriptional regulator [Sphingomonas panni]|uniref:Lrp/AsnC family transcriptional regulator n=1 Tax=Sphingomonas panni TaxID=237612 RepID=UPI001F5BE5B9|nr:Lrp/AsnC family transcriptional regulator [Sphingomonas panni]
MSADNPHPSKRELDARLLALLRQDSRVPVSELAHVLNVSRAHVYASIARMEQDGTIDGYTVRLGEAHDRRMVRAHVMMTTLPKLLDETNEALAAIPELTGLYAIAGEYDLIAMVEAPSLERLNDVIDAIGRLAGIGRTMSAVVLATRLRR